MNCVDEVRTILEEYFFIPDMLILEVKPCKSTIINGRASQKMEMVFQIEKRTIIILKNKRRKTPHYLWDDPIEDS